ncbi:hypothetical protein [Halobacterium sp. CBA1126]|uniref:hypothetical protein n=1 Tax=Halobacterium sp. CBA1126 TaxID=2668074 RepID=UPI0012FC0CBE|nr:hypothetical protein [Halobacterium sp. CBA1126]MUV60616.1 hypothetical protein [Halobacterium sp. CBA1126]
MVVEKTGRIYENGTFLLGEQYAGLTATVTVEFEDVPPEEAIEERYECIFCRYRGNTEQQVLDHLQTKHGDIIANQ